MNTPIASDQGDLIRDSIPESSRPSQRKAPPAQRLEGKGERGRGKTPPSHVGCFARPCIIAWVRKNDDDRSYTPKRPFSRKPHIGTKKLHGYTEPFYDYFVTPALNAKNEK